MYLYIYNFIDNSKRLSLALSVHIEVAILPNAVTMYNEYKQYYPIWTSYQPIIYGRAYSSESQCKMNAAPVGFITWVNGACYDSKRITCDRKSKSMNGFPIFISEMQAFFPLHIHLYIYAFIHNLH